MHLGFLFVKGENIKEYSLRQLFDKLQLTLAIHFCRAHGRIATAQWPSIGSKVSHNDCCWGKRMKIENGNSKKCKLHLAISTITGLGAKKGAKIG